MDLHKVEIAFHEAGSTKNLELMLSLFADDAVLIAGGKTYTGKDQVKSYWQAAGPFQPQNQWVGYTPAFRIQYSVKDDRAHLYFECLWVDKAAGKIAAHTNSDDMLARVNGRWLIKDMKAASVPELSPCPAAPIIDPAPARGRRLIRRGAALMRRLLLLFVGLSLWLGIGTAQAGALIEIPNLPGMEPAHLFGYFARPDGDGPFPAIVVLPDCMGFSGHSASTADQLQRWGYVAVTVDSLGPRGLSGVCESPFLGQITDAFAALRYLSRLSYVDADGVAVLGYSRGGFSALNAVDRIPITQSFDRKFRAAVAYYPDCGISAAVMTAPTLILIGEADDWTPAATCRQLVALTRREGAPIELQVYPGAYHGFDVRLLRSGIRCLGHWLEYNEPAAKDAEERVRVFLAANLGVAPSREP